MVSMSAPPFLQYWDSAQPQEEVIEQEVEPQPLFPEAIPVPERLHTTPSEITQTQPTTAGGEREVMSQHSLPEVKYVVLVVPLYAVFTCLSICREKVSRKPKRLARSQIPTKPVEMPDGIESLDVQVCVHLGIIPTLGSFLIWNAWFI